MPDKEKALQLTMEIYDVLKEMKSDFKEIKNTVNRIESNQHGIVKLIGIE